MFSASADLYDIIYSSFKDYGAEAEQIDALLRAEHPRCRSLLDVGCGTGEHARRLAALGYHVDGLDLDPNLLGIAAAKHSAGRFVQADMCAFALDNSYDAILCLFSSIGYAGTPARVALALGCFRRHLAPGGIAVVEPWFTPGALQPGRTTTRTIDRPPLHIVRTSTNDVSGRMSRLTFEYEVTDARGTRHATEVHELGLFTVEEMTRAFAEAGLTVSYDPVGLTGRGLYVARAAA